jgi:type VI secretion system protein ImpC
MEDFEPARIAEQVPALKELLRSRQRLVELLDRLEGNDVLEKLLWENVGNPEMQQALLDSMARAMEIDPPEPPPPPPRAVFDLEELDLTTRPPFDARQHRREVLGRLLELVREFVRVSQLPGQVRGRDTAESVKLWIAAIDRKLTAQLDEIMHHPAFQKLEGTWRGLDYLVRQTNTGEILRIHVLNATKDELSDDLGAAAGFEESDLFRKVYGEAFGTLGGTPFGLLVGDYEFDCKSAADVGLLRKLGGIAAAAHAPFVAAVSPTAFGFERWTELASPRDLGLIFGAPEYAAWDAFRGSEESRFVALTLPRVPARVPYGEKGRPVAEFAFEEDTTAHDRHVWMSAAWCYAACVTYAYDRHGWPARTRGVEGGGKVEGLPVLTFPDDDGDPGTPRTTEALMNDRREMELESLGFLPLVHCRDRDYAVFHGNRPCWNMFPRTTGTYPHTSTGFLGINFLLCAGLFTHTLAVLVRNRVGPVMEAADLQQWLSRWITGYIHPDPETGSEHDKAQKPLAWAEVKVTNVPGRPGEYRVVTTLRPCFQLEPRDVTLGMTVRQLSVM